MKRQMARRFWWLAIATAAVLAAAALAVLGLLGLLGGGSGGNGPLFMGSYGLDGWRSKKPVGIIIPITSKTHATIAIDRIRLIGGAGYPSPRPFALRVIDYTQCAGVWPLRQTGHGLVLDGCAAYDLGPLIGHRVHWSGRGTAYQVEAVAKVWPPRSRSCWVLTHVAVRYHIIGGRHFSAIYPDAEVTCSGIARPVEQAVMDQAAEEASH